MRTHVAALSGFFLAASGALAAAEDRDVPAFDSVHVASGIRAAITVGARKPVHLEADKDVLEAIETRVVRNPHLWLTRCDANQLETRC